jgi:hypothetical protein
VIPVASGAQLTKVDKAFSELVGLGLVASRLAVSDSGIPPRPGLLPQRDWRI